MSWRAANSLQRLRDQLNETYPGWLFLGFLGDQAHASVPSDHNPNSAGVVCALDIGPGGGLDIHALADRIVANPHPDLKYIISNRRIAEWQNGFQWQPYGGADPHDTHIHISVGRGADGQSRQPYDDTNNWNIIGGDMEIGYDTANQIHQDLTGKNWAQSSWASSSKGKNFADTYALVQGSQARKDYFNYIATLEKNPPGFKAVTEQLYQKV